MGRKGTLGKSEKLHNFGTVTSKLFLNIVSSNAFGTVVPGVSLRKERLHGNHCGEQPELELPFMQAVGMVSDPRAVALVWVVGGGFAG